MPLTLGSEILLTSSRLHGLRIGLVCNPASVDGRLQHVTDACLARGVTPGAIFGPQHGFRADVQDNMIETAHARDPKRAIPIYSLYSETREPTAEMLRGLDVLVIDLQEIGARIYTFIATMAACLRAGRRHGLPVIVCDRPNPIGGDAVEGPMLAPGFESFVGPFPMPMRHGMTMGELAWLFNEHFGLGADLLIVPMEGWTRDQYWDDTGLPWVMTSPNVPTADTAIVYPGTVLLEGTMASEGRGTTRPFEIVGAPWVDAESFAARLNAARLAGVHFRPVVFEPTFQKHAGRACGGCQIHVRNRRTFRPVQAAVAIISELRRANPGAFAWRQPPYEYETVKLPIDILAGSDRLRRQIEQGMDATDIAGEWELDVAGFGEVREQYLLY
ncbi:MAG: DUF1343 domain-containing protein [Acidobacteriota bacterium]|nr:DUF1343 domain-containing protein [Acidobacteriota bacterium]